LHRFIIFCFYTVLINIINFCRHTACSTSCSNSIDNFLLIFPFIHNGTDISCSRREKKDKSYQHHSDISVNYIPCGMQIRKDDREIILYKGRHIEKQNLIFHRYGEQINALCSIKLKTISYLKQNLINILF